MMLACTGYQAFEAHGFLKYLLLTQKRLENGHPEDTHSLIQKGAEILRRPIVLIGEKSCE